MGDHGSFIKNDLNSAELAKELLKGLNLDGKKDAVTKTLNLNINTTGVKDLEKANEQVKKINSALTQGRHKYIFADSSTAIKEATKNLEIYNKTTDKGSKKAINAAKEVFKWTNAYQAHGGNKSDLDKNLLDVASIGKSNIKTADSKGYNYSVAKFEESINLMKDAAKNGIDLSAIAAQFGMAEDKAKELANAFGYIQPKVENAKSAMSEIGAEAEKTSEKAKKSLEELRNEISNFQRSKLLKPSSRVTDDEMAERKKSLAEYKKMVDEYITAGGKLNPTKNDAITSRYIEAGGIVEGINDQQKFEQATKSATEAIIEQKAEIASKDTTKTDFSNQSKKEAQAASEAADAENKKKVVQSKKASVDTSAENQSKKDTKAAEETAQAENKKKEAQTKKAPVDTSAEDQSKREKKAAEDAVVAEQKLNDEQSKSVTPPASSNNTELANMANLEQKAKDVASAVDDKSTAFTNEQTTVDSVVNAEITKLQELIDKIGEVATTIDQLGTNHPVKLQLDETTTTAISDLKAALSGDWITSPDLSNVINTLKINKNVGENVQKLANAVTNLKSSLNNLGDGGANFLSSINALVGQGEELKALASVLKATKAEKEKAKQEIGLDKSIVDKDYFDSNMESMRDSAIKSLSGKYSDVRMVEIERSKKGIVTLTAAIQEADGTWKKFTGNINSDGALSTEGITELSKSKLDEIKAEEKELLRLKDEADKKKEKDDADKTKVSYDKEIRLLGEINELEIQNKNAAEETKAANDAKIASKKDELELLRKEREAQKLTSEIEQERVNRESNKLQNKLGNTANAQYIETVKNAIKVEKEYQELTAKEKNNVITSKEKERLEQVKLKRKQLNAEIEKTIELTTKETNKRDELLNLKNSKSVEKDKSSEYVNSINANKNAKAVTNAANQLQAIKDKGLIGLDEEIALTEKKIQDLNAEFLRGSIDVEKYEAGVKRALSGISNTLGKNLTKEQGIDVLKNKVKELVTEMGNVSNFKIKNVDTTTDGIVKLTYSFIDAEGKTKDMIASLTLLDGKFKTTADSAKNTSVIGNAFTSWEQGLKNALRYLTSFASIYRLIGAVKQGINTVIEFNTALTEMRKVSDESIDTLKSFQAESFSLADGVGTTALQIQQSTAEFMRLGETMEEAKKSAQVANILKNVSEFDSIDAATESLIAMKAAYEDVELSQMDIVDKLNQVGNNFAISTDGLATALQASASALKTANNNIDESIALITAGNAVVQDPDKVGAGLRTIALRITGTESAREELEELGEDTSDFIVQTSAKSQQAIKDFTKVASNNFQGFDILDENGNFKSTYEILLGISEIYEEIVATDKEYGSNMANGLLETLAGKNRANIAASILQNPQLLKDVYESSHDSEGSAQSELDKYLESLEAKIQQFKNTLQELATTVIDSGFLDNLIEAGTGFVKILDTIIEKVGVLPTLFAAAYGFSFLKQKMMDKEIIDPKPTLAGVLPGLLKKLFFKSETASATNEVATAIAGIAEEGTKASISLSGLATSASGLFAGLGSGAKTLWSSLNVLGKFTVVGAAVGVGLNVLLSIADHFHESAQEMIEKSEEAAKAIKSIQDEFKNTEDTVSKTSERFAKLAQGVDMLTGKNISLSDSEYAEFLDLSNQLAEVFPTLSRNYDENGNAIVQLSGDTDTMVGSLQALLDVERQLAAQKIVDELPDLYKGVNAKSVPIINELNDLKSQRDAYANFLTEESLDLFAENIDSVRDGGLVKIMFDPDADNEVLNEVRQQYFDLFKELGLGYEELSSEYEGAFGDSKAKGYVFMMDYMGLSDEEAEEARNKLANGIQGITETYSGKIDELNDQIQIKQNQNKANWSSVLSSISSWLSTNEIYMAMDDSMQSIAQSMINSLDFSNLKKTKWEDLSKYLEDTILTPMSGLEQDAKELLAKTWEDLFSVDIKALSATDYVKKVNSYLDTIANSLGMDEKERKELAINLGFDINFTTEQVDRIKEDIKNALPNVSDETIDGFTLAELNIAVKVADEAAERVDKEVNNILESERAKLESEMLELQDGGSVNLMLRPKEDYSGTIHTYRNDDNTIAMNFTPVMVDPDTGRYIGTLSSSDLEKYANEVINGAEDTKNLKIGATFEGEDAIEQAGKAVKRIKVLKKDYYNNVSDYFNGEVDAEVIKRAVDNALKRQMDIYKYLGEEAMVDAQDIMNDIGIKTIEEKMASYEKFATMTVDLFTSFTKVGNAFSIPANELLNASISHYNDNVKGINSTFVQSVDGYIDKSSELRVALGKLSDGTLSDSDLDRLKDLGVETGNIQELDDSIRNMLDGMNTDMLDGFVSQFGKIDSGPDRRELEKFMTTVLKLGSVVGSTKFDISIETESQGYENLSAAMQESVTATGLTSESISNLQDRYEELEAYDAAKLFEKTANGIHLNRQELNKLEAAYKADKTEMITDKVDELKKEYASLMKQIAKCSDPSVLQALYSRRDALVKEMQAVAETASQYDGLASAYNRWQIEQAAGNERDMYEGVLAGFDEVKKEMQRGWFDDDTVAFLELLTGEDLSTAPIEKQIEAYERLDDAINGAGYSIKDFFTKNGSDESTSTGVYNFLKAVNAAEELLGGADLVQKAEDGSYSFDFAKALFNVDGIEYEGDAAVAKVLGISEELVQIILRAADDAGFVINLEGAYTQLTQLKSSAEEAVDALKLLQGSNIVGSDKLVGLNLDFDFEATGDGIYEQLLKAQEVLDRYKVNGKVDMEIGGAKEATEIVYYFATMWDKLNEPAYMNLNASDVEGKLQEPLEKLQEFEELTREQYRLELVGDTEGVEEIEKKMKEIAKYIHDNGDLKASLNIDPKATEEEIMQMLENGEIEFPATAVVDLQVEMNDSLKEIVALMKREAGLIDDDELDLLLKYKIDSSELDNYTPGAKEAAVNYIAQHEEIDEYNPDAKEAVVHFLLENPDIINYTEDEQDVIIKYIAETGNWWASKEEIDSVVMEDKIVKLGVEDEATPVLQIWNTLSADDKFAKLSLDNQAEKSIELWDALKVDPKFAELSVEDQATQVIEFWNALPVEDKEAFINGTITAQDLTTSGTESATENIEGVPKESNTEINATDNVTSVVVDVSRELDHIDGKESHTYLYVHKITSETAQSSGTARVSGTARTNKYSSAMSAYAKGTDWRLPKNEEALVNEVGQESIVRDGRWFPIPGGAHVEKLRKGDIIFNAAQTEELIRTGRVISGGGHGRVAYANGTAFGGMGAYSGSSGSGPAETTISVAGGVTQNGSGNGSGDGNSEETKELLDWIEIKIERIEQAIAKLERTANSAFETFSKRNSALAEEIEKVSDEIEIQQQAYDRYMEEANSVGLDEEYAELVRNGTIDIENIADEDLREKIQDYQTWYNKAVECAEAIEDLAEQEKELYKQRFDNVITQYDGIVGIYDNEKSLIEAYADYAEAQGYADNSKYLSELKGLEAARQDALIAERNELQATLDQMVQDGTVEVGSEAYNEMVAEIQGLNIEIMNSKTAIEEYNNEIRQMSWDRFDELQEKISNVTRDADYLINLMSDADMFDEETGKITDQGLATMALHDANYEAYLSQVDEYKKAIDEINKDIAEDPSNTTLIERKEELIEKMQEAALSAKQEKQAMIDLVEEGINAELNAMKNLIDAYTEALDSQKD